VSRFTLSALRSTLSGLIVTHDTPPPSAATLVPTMGALHDGHRALIDLAKRTGRPVVVSIYVNPTQFNQRADFDTYPRDRDRDLALCESVGTDAVFAPTDDLMYPDGQEDLPPQPLPAVATDPGLEDRYRPGHFAGVCRVCRRLFELTRPAAAVFGEKDWQQLQAIRAVVAMDGLGIDIIPGPTVREHDGLALSSRNSRLTPDERPRALAISRALCEASGRPTQAAAESAMRGVLAEAGLDVEYAVVRDAETLGPVADGRPARALIAANVPSTRLIDNAEWTAAP